MNEWEQDNFERDAPQDSDLEEFGEESEPDMLPCPHCGQDVYENAQQCPNCGEYIVTRNSPHRRRSWPLLIEALLVVVLTLLLVKVGC